MTDLSLNEAARPRAPRIPGATDAQRRQGGRLALIHAMYLQDMARTRSLVEEIEAAATPDEARDGAEALAARLEEMPMLRNLRLFGSLCGQHCAHVMAHHDIEEAHMFPHLDRTTGEGFAPVLAKLRAEHEVIHARLEALALATQQMMQAPGAAAYAPLKEAFDALHADMESHFGYEETELREALGVYGGV